MEINQRNLRGENMSRGKNKKSGFFDLTDIRIEPEEAAEAENIRSVASETESEPE